MLKVGLTGGLGSGKTYVCHIFESLGVPVYNSDERAKWLMNNDAELVHSLKSAFGDDIYINGELDRPKLAAKVFNDKEALAKLNSLVHPAVFMDTEKWLVEHASAPYTIREAALIFETGSYLMLDKVITVTAPLDVRVQRGMIRDKATKEQILARIANQMDEAEKVQRADFVIYNDGVQDVEAQVRAIHQKLSEPQI